MLVRGLECRHRVARLLRALANGDVGHHRTPPSLAGSWSLDLSRSVKGDPCTVQHKLTFRSWCAAACDFSRSVRKRLLMFCHSRKAAPMLALQMEKPHALHL